MSQNRIRNFCIIAHIDHGKSTLADRLLEHTNTVSSREMKAQVLDQMDLERERGITIKLQPVRMEYCPQATDTRYTLNLIDTPGHVDFSYEVSRSLAAVEGAILLVDATQGVQAQTLTTLHQAQQAGLTIIPAVNKVDLPNAEPEVVAQEIITLLECADNDIIFTSGKTGEGVSELLDAIVQHVPTPSGDTDRPLRALIFDSIYDAYRGVISSIRVVDGSLAAGDEIQFLSTSHTDQAMDVGKFSPVMQSEPALLTGMIGYIVTGVKDVSQARVGDTITIAGSDTKPLSGYREPLPMVYAGLYATDGDMDALRTGLEKYSLNDASLDYEPDSSTAFGLGFRCGFLGLLHLEIVTQRLEREYDLELIVTTPSVQYETRTEGSKTIYSEPWVVTEILVPSPYVGAVMELAQSRRGELRDTKFLGEDTGQRALLTYELPLSFVIVDFYDTLKSVSSGYASLSYEVIGNKEDPKLVKLSILVAGEEIDELSRVVHRDDAYHLGISLLSKLKDLIPKQNFEVILQAAIGSKVIARERIAPLRKDVTAKLYGGDRSRKDKLLKKQAAGKKRLKKLGKVDIPTDVFIKLLR